MIIYGSKATQLAKESISESCPHCQQTNSIDMYVFQRYAHVFWIPFVAIGKTGVSQCAHCKQTLKFKDMPSSLKLAYQEIARQSKTPYWTFIGVALVGLLIINVIIQSGIHDARTSKLLQSPQAGDVLEVKKASGIYTLYKVADVRPDSVAVLPLLYSVNQESGLPHLASGKYAQYSDEQKYYSRGMLKTLHDRGEILDVIRK